jgi:hypothetical protein
VTGVLAAAVVLLGVGALVMVGVLLHRDLARINEQLARSGHQPDFRRDLDQLWADARGLHDEHARVTLKRLREVEAAVGEVRQSQGQMANYVNWMAPLVKGWASAAQETRR